MVESAPLLREYRLTPIEGSNPSLSATSFLRFPVFCFPLQPSTWPSVVFALRGGVLEAAFPGTFLDMHLFGFRNSLPGLILAVLGSTAGFSATAVEFDRDVAPILVGHCLECHNGSDLKGELNLSQQAGAAKGGKHGPAVVAGKPGESLLWEKVSGDDMPPDQPLGQAEKKVLHDWIAAGAKWGSTDTLDPFQFTTTKRGGYDWWSLQPVKRPGQPTVSQPDWAANPIDAFILNRLDSEKLRPSDPADPRALIRRLYFDLTGLPPSAKQVAVFVANPTDAAYRRVVDDLLSSPHYGERWGRHWLDLARFGESDGFERNNVRNNLWPYRDWVIRALNDDMPYDEFVRMQVAGDVLKPGDPAGQKAVGFLVAGLHNTVVGGSEFMKKTARQDELEEIIGTVGQTFVGLTVNCARCHNHKFDPIQQKEYYQMTSAIAGVFHGERNVSDPELTRQREALRKQVASLGEELTGIENRGREVALAKRKEGGPSDKPEPPKPLARWEFDTGLEDSLGSLHGVAKGDARIEGGALVVDGSDAWVETAPLAAPLKAKTLEAWVQLGTLDQKGGGVIGVEFASVWKSFGSDVTIVEALPHLVPNEDEACSKALERAYKKRGINLSLGVRFAGATQNESGVQVSLEDGTTIDADLLLVAVGRGPSTDGMGYDEQGVAMDRGWVLVDERLRTNLPGVFAVGDITPGLQLAHRGFQHGIFVAEEIAGEAPMPIPDINIPRVTYCEPEVASVGLTEIEAIEAHGTQRSVIDEGKEGVARPLARILGTGKVRQQIVAIDMNVEVLVSGAVAVQQLLLDVGLTRGGNQRREHVFQ